MKDWGTGLFEYSTLTFDLCYNGKDEGFRITDFPQSLYFKIKYIVE